MSKRVFAIPDLLEQIYDFGDAGRDAHHQKMAKLRNDLRLWFYDAATELEQSYYSSDPRGSSSRGHPFVTYLQECYSVEDQLDYVKYFKRCRCCSRHSHYKTHGKPIHPVPESRITAFCPCSCRHYSRFFQSNLLKN